MTPELHDFRGPSGCIATPLLFSAAWLIGRHEEHHMRNFLWASVGLATVRIATACYGAASLRNDLSDAVPNRKADQETCGQCNHARVYYKWRTTVKRSVTLYRCLGAAPYACGCAHKLRIHVLIGEGEVSGRAGAARRSSVEFEQEALSGALTVGDNVASGASLPASAKL